MNFIKKVYAILSFQLFITFLFVLWVFLDDNFYVFIRQHLWISYVCIGVTMITMYALACYKKVARSVPINYILLIIFTLAESYLVAMISSMYSRDVVLMAAALTAAVTIALTLYAIFTSTDYTECGGILVVCCVALIVGGIIGIFIKNKWL